MHHPALPENLRRMSPARPFERTTIEVELRHAEARLARSEHAVEADSHTLGFHHSEKLINRRDRDWAVVIAISQLLNSEPFSREFCRAVGCSNVVANAYEHASYCPSCFHAALTGEAAPRDPAALPPPVIGSPFGRDPHTERKVIP